jgi:hypothetical protein
VARAPERLVDAAGRPYFLWDVDMTLATFRERLADSDPEVRGYVLGKLMRQAKPDDVLTMVSIVDIAAEWPALERYLGDARPFWEWIVGWWRSGHGAR